MALKHFKPTTPSLRTMTVSSFASITRNYPEKSLVKGKKKTGGRNNRGVITSRFRGGGAKKRYRFIDFKRQKFNIPAKVSEIEYDPNRTAYIALLHYLDGEKKYILAPEGLKVGDLIESGENVDYKIGNSMPLKAIPLGEDIHNIELTPGRGGQLVRSAGQSAILRSRDGEYAQIKLPSKEIRLIHIKCYATLGKVSNLEHKNITLGKAGKKRHLGRKPHVRGVAMNPVDHPMGGGEGKSSGGGHPRSPWGWLTKGKKTRKKSKNSSKFIIKSKRDK